MASYTVEAMRKNADQYFVSQFDIGLNIEELVCGPGDDLKPEWNWCSICCVRMIALSLNLNPPSLREMYRTAFDQYQVFRFKDEGIVGAYHNELALYVSREFSLAAKVRRHQCIKDVVKIIQDDCFFLASVSPEIRTREKGFAKRKNGHIVLVFGVGRLNGVGGFILHNSSGSSMAKTQKSTFVSFEWFDQCFSGNGIVVQKSI